MHQLPELCVLQTFAVTSGLVLLFLYFAIRWYTTVFHGACLQVYPEQLQL